MSIKVKANSKFLKDIRTDLLRPHPYAAERVGFVTTRLFNGSTCDKVVVLDGYLSIDDDEYVQNDNVGAEIGQAAVRRMLEQILCSALGLMHVHMHQHTGTPRLSRTDVAGLPPLIQGFQNLGMDVANGILLLSEDQLDAWVWVKGESPERVSKFTVTAYPMQIMGGDFIGR